NGDGTLWRLSPVGDGTYQEKILHLLSSSEGFAPNTPLLAAGGTLYGTLFPGGPGGAGAVYQSTSRVGEKRADTPHVGISRHHRDGLFPGGPLSMDRAGNLYGINSDYGAEGAGTLFMLTRNSDGSYSKSVLFTFGPKNTTAPSYPVGAIVFDRNGSAYGYTN